MILRRELETRDERRARGRALRGAVRRRENADWLAAPGRRDPIDILIRQGESRIAELLPIRYGRMQTSPLAFLRGAAAVMASDLATTPAAGIPVQACGDCHLNNFGSYATPEGIAVFDINDFDETHPAPFEWDLKRLATSLVLAGRQAGASSRGARDLALSAAHAYVAEIRRLAGLSPLAAWYTRIDLESVIEAIPKHRVRTHLQRRFSQQIASVRGQFGIVDHGRLPRLVDRPPLIERLPSHDETLREAFARYVSQLPPERRMVVERYRLRDIVFKVVGVGSVGTFCALGLYTTEDGQSLILQIKEAQHSVLEPYTAPSDFSNMGERVVTGQRVMQAASDVFLGWTRSQGTKTQTKDSAGAGREFYVRQAKDSRLASLSEQIEADLLDVYAPLCGRALGRAHARSGDTALLSGYLGRGRSFSDAIASFAVLYADQTERDYKQFIAACEHGRL